MLACADRWIRIEELPARPVRRGFAQGSPGHRPGRPRARRTIAQSPRLKNSAFLPFVMFMLCQLPSTHTPALSTSLSLSLSVFLPLFVMLPLGQETWNVQAALSLKVCINKKEHVKQITKSKQAIDNCIWVALCLFVHLYIYIYTSMYECGWVLFRVAR